MKLVQMRATNHSEWCDQHLHNYKFSFDFALAQRLLITVNDQLIEVSIVFVYDYLRFEFKRTHSGV